MSDMEQIEIDYTRFHKGLCSLKELKILKERYKNKEIANEIDRKIKEMENEHDR